MSRVKEYKTIQRSEHYQVEAVVNKLIEEGWQPLGGIGVGMRNLYQVVVKYED